LLRNASQCFIQDGSNITTGHPTITITTSRKDEQLLIRICDNGPGMSEEIRRHIFEPFFTTKEVGKGTGLGLSISYFIITEHHKGNIETISTEGKGTEFIITLPLA
jgi:two-component system NtrC family sensor kinase